MLNLFNKILLETLKSLRRLTLEERSLHDQQKKWRKLNSHNNVYITNRFDLSLVTVGRFSYGPLFVNAPSGTTHPAHLFFGDFVSIAADVKFLLCAEHPLNDVSTFPYRTFVLKVQNEASLSKGDIHVDDDDV